MPERSPSLRTLELLVQLAQNPSLSAAARQVGIAQPNASRDLRRLESDLGLRLVERAGSGSTLTARGRLVAEWATPVIEHARVFRSALDALEPPRPDGLDVVASQTVSESLAPRWLAIFHARHSDETARLRVHNSARVIELVRAGDAELGYIETPSAPSDLESRQVGSDRLCVVVSPGHAWARRSGELTLAELAATPLVVREKGSGTRDTYERAVAHLDAVAPALELSSNAAVLGSAAIGAGPAVLSELAVAAAVGTGRVVRVPLTRPDALDRRLRAVWRRPGSLSRAASEFLQISAAP